jgi:hypothetical protein
VGAETGLLGEADVFGRRRGRGGFGVCRVVAFRSERQRQEVGGGRAGWSRFGRSGSDRRADGESGGAIGGAVRFPVGRGAGVFVSVSGAPQQAVERRSRFPLQPKKSGVKHECFLVLWVMRLGRGGGIIEVRTGTGNLYRCRVGATQTTPSLWPTRPPCRFRDDRSAVLELKSDLIPTCYRDPQLSALVRGVIGWEISRLGSPRPGGSVLNETHQLDRLNAHGIGTTASGRRQAQGPEVRHPRPDTEACTEPPPDR